MREYQQKRKHGVFQSYDINIDSYLHFGEEVIIQDEENAVTRRNSCCATFKFKVSN